MAEKVFIKLPEGTTNIIVNECVYRANEYGIITVSRAVADKLLADEFFTEAGAQNDGVEREHAMAADGTRAGAAAGIAVAATVAPKPQVSPLGIANPSTPAAPAAHSVSNKAGAK